MIINEFQQKIEAKETLGKCPICNHGVIEGMVVNMLLKTLLKNGVVTVKGLTSKKGIKFDTKMRYEKKGNEFFSWKMEQSLFYLVLG